MLERRVSGGDPREQFRQLQMLKGVFKTETCRFDVRGICDAGSECCFRHSIDPDRSIAQMVKPIRQKVFRELYEENFALPDEILFEIGKITEREYNERQDRKEAYQALRQETRRTRPRRSMSPTSVKSSEPRIIRNRTPTPPRTKQDNVPALEDVSDTNADRQRDNTSAGIAERSEEEHSDTDVEAAAPIEAQDDDINMEAIPENQTAPLLAIDDRSVVETTPQVDFGMSDDAMEMDPEAETAAPETVVEIVATYTGVEVATSLQEGIVDACLLYTSPSPRDKRQSRMPSSA